MLCCGGRSYESLVTLYTILPDLSDASYQFLHIAKPWATPSHASTRSFDWICAIIEMKQGHVARSRVAMSVDEPDHGSESILCRWILTARRRKSVW
jgi:hypothetical protein